MIPDNQPWTTHLGRIVQELQQSCAPEIQIAVVENQLIQAIQAVRHIRNCYNKTSATVNHD
jgi:hypothetical protein